MNIREAVNRLPSLHAKLEKFLDLEASAFVDEANAWFKSDRPITLMFRLNISRDLVQGITSEELAALVAADAARAIRSKIEEMKEVNIPAILAEALREDSQHDGD